MSREIKFRAWDVKRKLWVYGTSAITFETGALLPLSVFWKLVEDGILINPCQCTEFEDKNGKEIYGGDILKDDDSPRLEKVGWDFAGWWIFDVKTGFNKRELFVDIEHKTIVGNVYENQKLLGGRV